MSEIVRKQIVEGRPWHRLSRPLHPFTGANLLPADVIAITYYLFELGKEPTLVHSDDLVPVDDFLTVAPTVDSLWGNEDEVGYTFKHTMDPNAFWVEGGKKYRLEHIFELKAIDAIECPQVLLTEVSVETVNAFDP